MLEKVIVEGTPIDKIVIKLKGSIIILLMLCCRLFPIKKNRITFISFYGKGYGDNGKYISMQLLKKKKPYEIYWVLKNDEDILPSGIKPLKYNSMKYFYILATSKFWFNNCHFPYWIRKRKRQIYFQLWHGCIALKKIEYDVEDKLSYAYMIAAKYDNKNADYFVSNSKFCTKVLYRGAFRYNKEILEIGTPRNDILINDDKTIIQKVKNKFLIDKDEKVVLYAPTFRNAYKNQYDIEYKKLISTLEKSTNCKWKILLRLHPNVFDKANEYNISFSNKIIDACYYDDMQELILSADIVITDYSSVMFDSMIANKPVILYANDIDSYNDERGTYFEFEELPFVLTKNNDELMNAVSNYNQEKILSKYLKFKKEIGLIENGNACKKIVDILNKVTYGESKSE